MVGVLAMASPLEDYSVQPCKKQRKAEDPSSKTITNYFSPLSKNAEKVLTSPRSNNIADYFIRRSPAAEFSPKATLTSPEHGFKHSQPPATPTSGTPKSAGRHTVQAKRTLIKRRLSELNSGESPDAGDGNKSPAAVGASGNRGSGGVAAETLEDRGGDNERESGKPATVETKKAPRQRSLKRKKDSETEQAREPAADPPAQSGSTGETSSLEVHVDSSSCNSGILTISFEDFLKSEVEKEQSAPGAKPLCVSLDRSDSPSGCNDIASRKASPRTVTVQAQVHLSPPLPNSNSHNSKIASIFQKKKDAEPKNKAEPATSESESAGNVIQKRKSNVVIQEDDLDLAVIDVETVSSAKQTSTPSERQQFMKAFRQVGDASKSSGKKPATRKKDASVTADGAENRGKVDGESDEPPDKGEDQAEAGNNNKTKRPPKGNKQISAAPKTTKTATSKKKAKPKEEAQEVPEPPAEISSPALRRSSRTRRSPERIQSEDLVLMSTPKVRTPCRKNDIYKSEVLTVPSDTESPIRMRFTRLSRRSGGRRKGSDDEAFTPGCRKVPGSSKKIDKAKQILQKAKAIQQKPPKRRSTRQQKLVPQEPICLDDGSNSAPVIQQTAPKNPNLRSLNDVLGKRAKATKTQSGQKKDLKKKVLTSDVITIDDGSEGSENSQDDEQFKAKREFLQSGLPDTLKRHIAKTTALREAYFLSCSSFQTTVHVQQKDGCPMWNLASPSSHLLTQLSALCVNVMDVTSLTLGIGDFTSVKAKCALQRHTGRLSKRCEFSEVIRDSLLEEIRSHNPPFPVRRILKQFLKKQSEYLSLHSKSGQKLDGIKQTEEGKDATELPAEDTGNRTKRKRKDLAGTESKRKKTAKDNEDLGAGQDSADAPLTRTARGRLSRASQKKDLPPPEPEVLIIEDQAPDTLCEDVLWTEKYQPQHSEELIGNSAAVRRLHSWLKEWKIRAEKEERRNQMQRTEKDENDTWDHGDFHDSEDSDEESLCNTVLITGPPGVGKTAAVYACAQELGFKVFEVNASCQRSGRQILAQLKEATQSHQVDQQGVGAHKPCFFSNYSTSKSPRKLKSPKRVVSSPRKPPISPRGPGLKKGLAPKSLANYFAPKAMPKQATEEKKRNPHITKVIEAELESKTSKVPPAAADKGADESYRKSATSLILFEEVDVIFEDDSGFLSAIKTFMSTTKRPVILTTSDPTFGMVFDGAFEEITFHAPSIVNVASYLQVLCLAENIRTDFKDFITLLTANKCDIRQSVLHLQFWARSRGEGSQEKLPGPRAPAVEDVKSSSTKASTELNVKDLPMCNFGCSKNMMGLDNILSPAEGVVSFVKDKIMEAAEWPKILQLLTEFQMRSTDFISCNLEFLLPLPLHVEEVQKPSAADKPEQDCPNEEDDIKASVQMKRKKRLLLLNDSDLFESDGDPLDDVSLDTAIPRNDGVTESLCTSSVVKNPSQPVVVKRQLSPEERKSSLLVHQCLDSLAEFADNMSSLDFSLCRTSHQADTCNQWTECKLKHGLCDGLRTDTKERWDTQSSGEMRALIEALSYRKCYSGLSTGLESSLELCKTLGSDPTEELTLHVSKAREEVYFGQPATTRNVSDRRLSVVKTVLSNRAFITLGNRQVNVTEYLPALRTICRLQKAKEEGRTKRRFLHYLEGIHLELPKGTLNSLAEDFP